MSAESVQRVKIWSPLPNGCRNRRSTAIGDRAVPLASRPSSAAKALDLPAEAIVLGATRALSRFRSLGSPLGGLGLPLGGLGLPLGSLGLPLDGLGSPLGGLACHKRTGRTPLLVEPQDIVLYGFGRIGRLLARILIDKAGSGEKLRLRAAVVRKGGSDDLVKRASLLRRDSIHGPFNGIITIDEEENAILANGNMIRIIYSDSPESVDYTQFGINNAILIDNTGKWRDREGLSRHLKSPGIEKVILTAPGKGDIPNIVAGVNNELITLRERIFSAASCTTNAIVPVMKAINDRFGIVHGHMETCHSYTNDQNLIDNYHKASRRGRSAPLNMVIAETGAAKAAAKVIPELAGRLTGNAIRVPTPNVSLAILNLELGQAVTVEQINNYLRGISLDSPLQNQIDYTNSPEVVSSDFVGSRHAGVVDSLATIAEGNRCVLYVWYDNEFGYSCQVVRLVQKMAGLELPVLPC